MSNGILGIKEVADYLDIKEQTVYRLVQQRKIPALKIGGQWKIKGEHLDQMFEKILQEKSDSYAIRQPTFMTDTLISLK